MTVWADYKFKIKKKLTHNKAECHATGGGSYIQYVLSPTEEAASNLLQVNSLVNAGDEALGFKRSSQNKNCGNEEDIPMIDNLENNEPFCSNQSTKPKQHNTVPKIVRALPTKIPIQNNNVVEEVRSSQSSKKTPVKKTTQNNEILGEQSLTPSTKKTPTKKKKQKRTILGSNWKWKQLYTQK